MNVQKVGVIGAGQMGSGIAQLFATSQFQVTLIDAYDSALEKGIAAVDKSLSKLEQKGKLNEGKDTIMNRLSSNKEIASLQEADQEADFVVEAVSENFSLKEKLFQEMDKTCPSHTIFASNTSSIAITKIAATTQRPSQVIGMHFMNPPAIMKLVELIRGLDTSEDTYQVAKDLAEKLGKETIKSEDSTGFVVNRILVPMINEAIFVLQEGLASAEDIDKGMLLGTNQPIGPLALADLIGLDTVLYIAEILYSEIGDPKFRPCPLLRKYVAAGHLGRKTGRGFYTY